MPTSQTVTTIYNGALDMIVENPISTLADSSPYTRWLNRNFPLVVETALRQQPWNFACSLFKLSVEPDAPPFRWTYQYKLPPGWLRVLPLTYDGDRNGQPVPHEVKSNYLMTNKAAPLPVECVMNIQDPGKWDPLFASLVIARLAYGMANRFTGKDKYVQIAKMTAQAALDTAQAVNAFEGSLMPVEQFDIIRARGDDTSWW